MPRRPPRRHRTKECIRPGNKVVRQLVLRAKGGAPIHIPRLELTDASDPGYALSGVPAMPRQPAALPAVINPVFASVDYRSWGVQGGASSTLVEAPQAPDRRGARQGTQVNSSESWG